MPGAASGRCPASQRSAAAHAVAALRSPVPSVCRVRVASVPIRQPAHSNAFQAWLSGVRSRSWAGICSPLVSQVKMVIIAASCGSARVIPWPIWRSIHSWRQDKLISHLAIGLSIHDWQAAGLVIYIVSRYKSAGSQP